MMVHPHSGTLKDRRKGSQYKVKQKEEKTKLYLVSYTLPNMEALHKYTEKRLENKYIIMFTAVFSGYGNMDKLFLSLHILMFFKLSTMYQQDLLFKRRKKIYNFNLAHLRKINDHN